VTADQLIELAAKASADSFRRYPHDRTERLADEAASLRTLVELAANALREHEQEPNR
jgi:hypothetical protein